MKWYQQRNSIANINNIYTLEEWLDHQQTELPTFQMFHKSW